MISMLSEEGRMKVGVYEYVIDTLAELSDVPTNVHAGSMVYCIENSKKYMLNNSGTYVEVNFKKGGSGGEAKLGSKDISENGTYIANEFDLDGWSQVNVDVENTYHLTDEGKVVQNGELVAQTGVTKTANGTYDTTINNQVIINVPEPSGSITITENGENIDIAQYASANVNVPTGGGGASPKLSGVNFIDYDGSLVQHYTAEEFASLSAMPANPSHEGLTAQGWNWSLTDAKTYVAKYGNLNIGQMYITTSGKTEIDVILHDGRLNPSVGIYLNGTAVIDWGDGTMPDTVTGTSTSTLKQTDHVYASEGSYTVTINVTGLMEIKGLTSSKGCSLFCAPSSANTTARQAYQNAIQALRIGNGVASIRDSAFSSCYSLTSVTIPEGVTSIGNNAFYYCHSLTSVTIPEGVTSIGSETFNACYSLALVMIPKSVTSIRGNAFKDCSSLTSVTIPEGVTSIGNSAFGSCYSLTSVTIPEGVTSIGSDVFDTCYSLTSVTIPKGVTSIGARVFSSCRSLVSVTIPEDMTSIGSDMFGSCNSLVSVTIPEGVTVLGSGAFIYCYSLAYVRLKPTTPPTLINANAFNNIAADCIFYVPNESLADYQAATNWSTYASRMVGE